MKHVSINYQGRGMTQPFLVSLVMDPTELADVPYPEFVAREVERCLRKLAEAGTRLVASEILQIEGDLPPVEAAITQGLLRPDTDVIDQAMRTAYEELLVAEDRGNGAVWATDVMPILENVHRALVHGHHPHHDKAPTLPPEPEVSGK